MSYQLSLSGASKHVEATYVLCIICSSNLTEQDKRCSFLLIYASSLVSSDPFQANLICNIMQHPMASVADCWGLSTAKVNEHMNGNHPKSSACKGQEAPLFDRQ